MELTERYKIALTFLGVSKPGKEYIKHIWNIAIRNEFRVSGVYVNVVIDEKEVACVDCTPDEICYVITAVRNPVQTPNEQQYYRALGNIVYSVRDLANNPRTLISCERVEAAYFD